MPMTPDERRARARAWLRDGRIIDGYPLHDEPQDPPADPRRPAFAVVAVGGKRKPGAEVAARGGLFETKERAA